MDPGERRLLAAMPLHAITALHGEPGLRERFAIETAGLPAPPRPGPARHWISPPGCTRATGASASPT